MTQTRQTELIGYIHWLQTDSSPNKKDSEATLVSIPLWTRLCLFFPAHSVDSQWAEQNKHNLGDNGMDTPVVL